MENKGLASDQQSQQNEKTNDENQKKEIAVEEQWHTVTTRRRAQQQKLQYLRLEEIWSTEIEGFAMFRVMQKQRLLHGPFRVLNKRKYSDIDKKEIVCRQAMEKAQNDLAEDPMNVHLQKIERDAMRDYLAVSDAARSFLQQKAKEN
ncbi:hypothetical protein RIF29_26493 [Crotalaria pallida]|uniref:Uncharacterized protein n=1 Tax=Crotalaria pallida TaxID=3830 RepID=A0AAN9EQ69_CROPI